MKISLLKNKYFFITIFLVIGIFLRFYNLNWGTPYFFHPDERNIATSINQLEYPKQMNPNFFAYGSLPIFTVYFIGVVKNIFLYCLPNFNACLSNEISLIELSKESIWPPMMHVTFENAIILSRFFSALLSTLLIPLVYISGRKLHSENAGLLASFFTLTSVGFIQFAHFGTFEIWITFFSVLLFLICIKIVKNKSFKLIILSGLIMGFLLAIKISNTVLFIIPLALVLHPISFKFRSNTNLKSQINITLKLLAKALVIVSISLITYIITNPYAIIDFPAFKNSISYESGVALGDVKVFYTHEFFDTKPVQFQILKVFPFIVNPLLTIIFIPSLIYIFYKTLINKKQIYLLLITFFCLLFFSQAFLFVKWTRYMIPTLPFLYLIIGIFITDTFHIINNKNLFNKIILNLIGLTCLMFALSYFKTAFLSPDTRISAAQWSINNLKKEKIAVSESYDLGIIAFNNIFNKIALCDIYNFEQSPNICNSFTLQDTIKQSNYIILPSERILKMSLLHKKRFPKRNNFYNSILNSTLYRLVYKTPCDIYCQITYLGDPLFSFEQTANVFDRPSVYIFEKI